MPLKRFMLVIVMLVMMVSTAHAQDTAKTFVLVHGAFQDASGWDATIAALEAAGQTAVAVNLPGRGDDTTPVSELNLNLYRDAVIEVINAQSGPVVLVGHSFGGMTISAVAEAIPQQIETLIYLAAYLPQSGDSLVSLASQDHFSLLGQEGNFIVSEDFAYGSVKADIFASAFCPDCNTEQSAQVAASQLQEPLGPQNEPISLTADAFGSVRKAYILTAEDVVVSPQLQALMLARVPAARVLALDTGHAPYISAPEALATALIEASA